MDLYLLHQPYGKVEEAWRALEEAKAEGRIRSIGVSNMSPRIWNEHVPGFDTLPAVNQVECNPYCQQRELRRMLDPLNVVIEAWGPLGQGRGDLLANPVITRIAEAHGKDAGQVVIRFKIQDGVVPLPKSARPERIRSNLDVFDFSLTDSEMEEMRGLDTGRAGWDVDAPGVGETLLEKYRIHD
jgi:diketogulonate reductase-like aldo/keto reductase